MRVLIVGGGPAGLTLAIALRRRQVDTELVELSADWNVLGTGLSLAGAPLRALNTIGMAEPCVLAGFGINTLSIGTVKGEITTTVERPRLNGPAYPASLGILRPVLHQVLAREAARAQAQLRLGVTVSGLVQEEHHVEVQFTDGTSGTYDLVVGADGLRSKIRATVFESPEQPRFTGQGVWRAMLPRPASVLGSAMYYGPRSKVGLTPVSTDEMYLFLVENVADATRPPSERLPALLREQLDEFGGLIGLLRDQIVRSANVDYRPLYSLLLQPPWYRGRIVLIGDAAHATTPHLAAGAGLAMEDAVVLAEVWNSGLAPLQALEMFMARRYERCRTIVANSLQLGEWEKHPEDASADPLGLSQRSWETLAQPI